MPAFDLVQGRCKGVKTWDPLPRPTMKFPHILVDNAVMFELLREAHYMLPALGPGSVDDQAQGWWPRASHIERYLYQSRIHHSFTLRDLQHCPLSQGQRSHATSSQHLDVGGSQQCCACWCPQGGLEIQVLQQGSDHPCNVSRVTTSGHAFGLHINTGAYTQIKRASLSTDCVSVDFHLFRPKLPAPAQPSPEVASTSSAASPSAHAVPTPPRPGASKFTRTGSRRKKKKVDRTKGLAGRLVFPLA